MLISFLEAYLDRTIYDNHIQPTPGLIRTGGNKNLRERTD